MVELGIVAEVNLEHVKFEHQPLPGMDMDSLLGASAFAVKTTHHKCGRCWRHLPDVAEDGALCSRCDQVVAAMDAAP